MSYYVRGIQGVNCWDFTLVALAFGAAGFHGAYTRGTLTWSY